MENQDMARYTPRNPMPLAEAVNQLMRVAFTMPFGIGAGAALAAGTLAAGTLAAGTLAAGMNLFETDDSYIVQVPLPGVRPDQLNITARARTS